MRLRKTIRKPSGEMEMTPLIDVVFLLIIFFMIVSQLVHADVEELTLPDADTGSATTEAQPGKIIVNVPASGELLIGGRVVPPDVFEQLLAGELATRSADDVSVLIRGDREAPWSPIGRAMLACARNGIAKVRVAVVHADADAAQRSSE